MSAIVEHVHGGTLTIRGGTIALPSGLAEGDVAIEDGKIVEIGDIPPSRVRGEVIKAAHLLVMPGVIDPQVHFREPGLVHKEDLGSGSRACAAGGVTSFLEMPNTNPPTTTEEALAWKKARAAETSVVDFGFFIGATKDNLEVLNRVEQVPGIKIFMGSSTGSLLVSERADLDRIFGTGSRLIAVHAEDEARLVERKKQLAAQTDPAVHSEIRDAEAALLATKLAVELSDRYGRRLHVLHMSTKEEAALLRAHGKGGGRITCEVTPQHLFLNAPDVYQRLGTRAQMNPPLRTKDHSDALWAALKDGTVDCIATDHAPHTRDEKAEGYPRAPAGMPGVETSLALMLDAARRNRCNVLDVVRWMSSAPAKIYGIHGKGSIELGFDGDFAIVDLTKRQVVGERGYFTKVGWSPFEGTELQGWTTITIVRGKVVFRDGAIEGDPSGRAVRFSS